MNHVRKLLSTLGGIFLAALLVAALAPKAARGVAAVLVQVTNTTSNPVPMIDSFKSASHLVELQCGSTLHSANTCSGIVRGTFQDPFKVPAGQSLVVTSIVTTAIPSQLDTVQLEVDAQDPISQSDIVLEKYVLSTFTTSELQFPSGIVYRSGLTPFFVEFGNTPVSVNMHGYLTSN
jgi:hypothetical protein